TMTVTEESNSTNHLKSIFDQSLAVLCEDSAKTGSQTKWQRRTSLPCTSTQSIFKSAPWIMRRKRWHHFGRSRNPSVRNCKAVCRITAGRLLDPPKPYLRFFQIIDAHRCRGCHRRSVLW